MQIPFYEVHVCQKSGLTKQKIRWLVSLVKKSHIVRGITTVPISEIKSTMRFYFGNLHN